MNELIKEDFFSIYEKDNICFIDFSHKKTLNSVDIKLSSLLFKFFQIKNKKSQIQNFIDENKCVLLVCRSTLPNIFSAGGNIKELKDLPAKQGTMYTKGPLSYCSTIPKLNIPSVTLLNAPAFGGGVELALATDFRWSTGENVEFHLSQGKFGVPGGWEGMMRLAEVSSLSHRKTSFLFLAQEKMTYEELKQLNIIDKSFSSEIEMQLALEKWKDTLLNCCEKLRHDYKKRIYQGTKNLEKFDKLFFKRHFLSKNHKEKIKDFLENKAVHK